MPRGQKSFERIKNYSTTVSADKTIAEIERMRAVHKALRIMKTYGPEGDVAGLLFSINTTHGELAIKLPCNVEAVFNLLNAKKKRGPNSSNAARHEQAHRVAWRILKDWIEAQLSLFDIEMVKLEEVFLPYVYDPKRDQTMFQIIEKHGFLKALPEGKKDAGDR